MAHGTVMQYKNAPLPTYQRRKSKIAAQKKGLIVYASFVGYPDNYITSIDIEITFVQWLGLK